MACPELAPLIQAGGEVDERVVDCVEGACEPLRAAAVDTVILGCTHYPLVSPVLQRALGRGVTMVSSGQAIADEVEVELRAGGLEREEGRRGELPLPRARATRGVPPVGTRFLQLPIGEVRHVDVAAPGGAPRSGRMSDRTNDGRSPDRAAPGRTSDPASCARPPARR